MPNDPAPKPAEEGPQDDKKMTEDQSTRLKKAAQESGKEEAEDDHFRKRARSSASTC